MKILKYHNQKMDKIKIDYYYIYNTKLFKLLKY